MIRNSQTTTKIVGNFVLIGFAMFFSHARFVWAGSEKFDQQMQPILDQYLKIPEALAADKVEGVNDAAKNIEQLAGKLDPAQVTGEHKKHYKNIPSKLKAAARKIAKTKDIGSMREALKDLSKPMAMWVTMSKPKGVSVVYCSMAPGSWIQRGTTIANPYYGVKMLRCGEIVAGEGVKKVEQHKH